ncbi:MAG: DUF5519 family protein [Actinomycetota bacterium]|nr:DUF5519 family protein [Actinomycetota bacterium]
MDNALLEAVRRELLAHPGVVEAPHRFGGVAFRLGRRELGHLHGDRLADLPLPRRVRDEVIAQGRAMPHHMLPDSGWVSRRVHGPEDVAAVVELFRLSYECAAAQAERARERDPAGVPGS